MKFGDGGNVITERLFNFTEAYVCLKRLETDQSPEVSQARVMQRRSTGRKAPDSAEAAQRASPRTTARAKPRNTIVPSSRKSIRLPSAIKEEDVVDVPAKRTQLNDDAMMASPNVDKPAHRNHTSPKQTSEEKNPVSGVEDAADLKQNLAGKSPHQGIQTEHLRECSIILKSVEIPDTVYLDKKTKRRLSSLFKACRKAGKKRTGAFQEDPTLDSDDLTLMKKQPEATDESKRGRKTPVSSKTPARGTIGKRQRDSAASSGDEASRTSNSGEIPPASSSKLLQKRRSSEKTPAASRSENPSKRRRLSTKTNGQVSLIESGQKASRQKSNKETSSKVDDKDESSMCWDESPDKSPEKVGEGEAVTSGVGTPSESADSDLALPSHHIPAPGHLNGGGELSRNHSAVPQTGRCAHCTCPCKVEEDTVDKNQPLITSFLRRTSRKANDTPNNLNSAMTESQPTLSSTEEPRIGVRTEDSTEPMQDRPADNESISAAPPSDSTQKKSPEDLQTEITSRENLDELHDVSSDADVRSSAVADEGCSKFVDNPSGDREEQTVSPEDPQVSEPIQDKVQTEESVACEDGSTVAEETCNGCERDRCSVRSEVSEVKLVLEESSDGAPEEECEVTDGVSATASNILPSCVETKCGDVDDESGKESETPVATDVVMKDDIHVDNTGDASPSEGAEPEKLETRETRAEGHSARHDTCDPEKEADVEAGTSVDSPLREEVSVTDREETTVTESNAGDDKDKNSAKHDECCEDSDHADDKSSTQAVVLDEDSEKGLETNNDAKIEIELTSECLLDTEKSSAPEQLDHAEKSESVTEMPTATVDGDEAEICDSVNDPSSGSEVLCFLGADSKDTSVDLGVEPSISPENSHDVDRESKIDEQKCQSDKMDQGKAVVEALPTVG